MAVFNRSLAPALFISIVAQFGTACAPAMIRPAPGENPAEIVLPPSNSHGGLDQIRNDLSQFTIGERHSHTRPAKCKTCVVDVAIHSIGLTTDIVPLIGPARFRIIGWAKNNDTTNTEDEYSLKPGAEYLIWVKPAPTVNAAGTSKTLWGILELPAGSTGLIEPIMIGYVERCDHQKPSGTWKSDTDFKDCDKAHVTRGVPSDEPRQGVPAFFAVSSEPSTRLVVAAGAWFDCGGYCCTGTSVQQ